MKRLVLLVLVIFFLTPSIQVKATNEMGGDVDLIKMHATAYCIEGKTYSGKHTRRGIAAASKEYIGKTALVYQRLPGDEVGDLIGIYEIEDTGGTEGLTSGNVIDIWCPDLDACQEFMNTVYEDGCKGRVWVEIVEAVG